MTTKKFFAKTPHAHREEAWIKGIANTWAAIADDIADAYEKGYMRDVRGRRLKLTAAAAASATIDGGCFDMYCRLTPEEIADWHAQAIKHYRKMMNLAVYVLKGYV